MYENLASFYDMYTSDVDFSGLADFLEEKFRLYGNDGLKKLAGSPKARRKRAASGDSNGTDVNESTLVIDVGCGTGKLTVLLCGRGYDMTGLDVSPEMLEIAREKACRKKMRILWLCQDMRFMDTYGSYAAMYCLEDGLNHLLEDGDLDLFFANAFNFIDDGGLLIFDFLTDRYFRDAAEQGVFYEDGGDGTCIWTADYEDGFMTYDIVCYAKAGEGGLYERFDDSVTERAYAREEIEAALARCGFTALEFTESPEQPGRIYAVAKKAC